MSDEVIDLEPDEPPKNGEWLDPEDLYRNLTDAEWKNGQNLGLFIDTNSDDDNGSHIRAIGSAVDERAIALSKAQVMKNIMLDYGVPEVSIELQPGRPNVYGSWDAGFFVADMSHHTVSSPGMNKTPCLSVVKNGRSDLPGPLANGYGGWDLCYRIITLGYANHPGEGGPFVVPTLHSGGYRIPKDSGRRYLWGTEFEGGLKSSDWDATYRNPRNGKRMTFREFMGRVNRALQDALVIAGAAHLEHSTWAPGRKIDRLDYTAASGIAEKNRYGAKVRRMPVVDLSNVRGEFRKALKLDKGPVVRRYGVKVIQTALDVSPTGLVDANTLEAWRKWESKHGGLGWQRVPDAVSLGKLATAKHFKVVE